VSDFRILVTGSREWGDRRALFGALDGVLAEVAWQARQRGEKWSVTVVHGACPSGADLYAHMWYTSRLGVWGAERVREAPHPADWETCSWPDCTPAHRKLRPDGTDYCPGAGFWRNQQMVSQGADACLAFLWTGAGNRGTWDCAGRAQVADMPVRHVRGGPS
jgi:YspA, cpYpsA-related SLOG family